MLVFNNNIVFLTAQTFLLRAAPTETMRMRPGVVPVLLVESGGDLVFWPSLWCSPGQSSAGRRPLPPRTTPARPRLMLSSRFSRGKTSLRRTLCWCLLSPAALPPGPPPATHQLPQPPPLPPPPPVRSLLAGFSQSNL